MIKILPNEVWMIVGFNAIFHAWMHLWLMCVYHALNISFFPDTLPYGLLKSEKCIVYNNVC